MSKENLVYISSRPIEEQRAIQKAGTEASRVKRRKNKTFRESIKAILAATVDDPETQAQLRTMGLDDTMLDAINLAQAVQAARGNTDAARFCRDTAGEKPRDALELGNLDDRPLATIDLSKLSDDELRAMAAARKGEAENPE